MNGDLKTTFIQVALKNYMEDVMETMRIAAQRSKVHVTGEGVRSLAFSVAELGKGATASLSFKEYLRFVDMGVAKGHPLGGMTSMRKTLQASNTVGDVLVKKKGRKPKKIYSKVVYGKLTHLQNHLLFGYTEETIEMLKKNLTT